MIHMASGLTVAFGHIHIGKFYLISIQLLLPHIFNKNLILFFFQTQFNFSKTFVFQKFFSVFFGRQISNILKHISVLENAKFNLVE